MMRYGWGQPMVGGAYGFGIVGMVVNVLVWALIVVAIVVVVRAVTRHHRMFNDFSESGGDRALDILRERYAKGEITKKEFEEMKKDISKG